jgi:hypothetical protein
MRHARLAGVFFSTTAPGSGSMSLMVGASTPGIAAEIGDNFADLPFARNTIAMND